MRRSIKKKALAIMLIAAMLMPSGVSWSDQVAVQAMEITENEPAIEAATDQGQPPDTGIPEAEPIENFTMEEMEGELPGFYDGCNLKSKSMYAAKTLLVETDSETFDTFGASNSICFEGIYILSYDTIGKTKEAYAALSGLDGMERVEVDAVLETGTAGVRERQENSQRQPSELKSYLEKRQPVKETIAAVIDTGYLQESGNERIINIGYNVSSSGDEGSIEDDNGHGTQMAEIMLANTPGLVKIMPLKAANNQGKATVMSAYLAIHKAMEQEVDLILISMNAKASTESNILTAAIQEAAEKGIQVVVSAGNSGMDVKGITPSNIEEAIVVGAVNDDGSPTGYSNYGDMVDYCSFGTYQENKGTSYAAAYVCAAAAYCSAIGEDYKEAFGSNLIELGTTEPYCGRGLVAFIKPVESGDGEISDNNQESEYIIDSNDDELSVSATPYLDLNGKFYISIEHPSYLKGATYTFKTTLVGGATGAYPEYFQYHNGAQSFSWSMSRSGRDFGGTLSNPNTTKKDKQPGLAVDRQYLLPVSVTFANYTGYYIGINPDCTETYEVYNMTFSGSTFSADLDTNGLGMTVFHRDPLGIDKSKKSYHNFMLSYIPYKINYNYKKGSSDTTGTVTSKTIEYDMDLNLAKGTNFKGRSYSIKFNENGGSAVSDISGNLSPAANFWKVGSDSYAKQGYVSVGKSNSYFSTYGTSVDVTAQWDSKVVTLPTPTLTGYTFNGWYENSSLTGTAITSCTINPSTSAFSKDLYAKWTINTSTLMVNPNVGTWNNNTTAKSFPQNYNTEKSVPVPSRAGYQFNGWTRTNTYGSMSSLTEAATYTYGATNDVTDTLTAQWTKNTYYVKYDRNDGINPKEIGTGTMEKSKHKYDENQNLTKNAFERAYYNFTGWNTKADGSETPYTDEQSVKNLTTTNVDTITLYAQWEKKQFNVAYSGNGQTDGTNMLENNIQHGDTYIYRDNVFEKQEKETRKTESGEEYETEQKYGFQGWGLVTTYNNGYVYESGEEKPASELYMEALLSNAVSAKLWDISTYEEVQPLKTALARNAAMATSGTTPAKEYINMRAIWDAYPTILVEPQPDADEDGSPRIEGNTLFFYEGEEPTKKNLIAHLTVTDKEDVELGVKDVKIKKIVYCDGQFITIDGNNKKGHTMEWEDDMPMDYTFDTYYLEMDEDEVLTHMITYEVTDSAGNTTAEQLPVKVKYNHYPEIEAPDIYYHFKEDANKGLITEQELLSNAVASDLEDKEKIKDKLVLVGFEPQSFKMQVEPRAEFGITYQVTDAFKKTTYRDVMVVIADADALQAEIPVTYVRYISDKYLDTLEPTSIWRQPENLAYLQNVLSNETAEETWYFTSEEVARVKKWILEDGDGNWKKGQEANREFLALFSECRQ